MIHTLQSTLGEAMVERLVLLVNHVVGAEPVAMQRLRPHAGRTVQIVFEHWPALLPAWPDLSLRITPAGLFERGLDGPIDPHPLRVTIDASNPALALLRSLNGTRPRVDVSGDAALAGDLNWLFANLRWDVQDDLARIVGAAPAREIARLGGAVASALQRLVGGINDLASGRQGAARGTDASSARSGSTEPPRQ